MKQFSHALHAGRDPPLSNYVSAPREKILQTTQALALLLTMYHEMVMLCGCMSGHSRRGKVIDLMLLRFVCDIYMGWQWHHSVYISKCCRYSILQ